MNEELVKSIEMHFSALRRETGNNPIPSKIEDEIKTIASISLQSNDPIDFLCSNGLLFFKDCCCINLEILTKRISSSKSRITAALRREKWIQSSKDLSYVKNVLHERTTQAEFRKWSYRDYPPNSKILDFLKHYSNLVIPEMKFDSLHFEGLSLQTNLDSFTISFEPYNSISF